MRRCGGEIVFASPQRNTHTHIRAHEHTHSHKSKKRRGFFLSFLLAWAEACVVVVVVVVVHTYGQREVENYKEGVCLVGFLFLRVLAFAYVWDAIVFDVSTNK